MDLNNCELMPNILAWLFPVFGHFDHDEQRLTEAKTNTKNLLKILDEALKIHTFLAANQLTVADIAIAGILSGCFKFIFDDNFRKQFANVTRWFENIANLPAFAKFFGKLYFCKQEW